MPVEGHHQAVVVGTGFSGLYALYLLKQQGLDVIGLESGADVGGTWYWNKYPGARSDVESHAYRLSFDKEALQDAQWPNNYLLQPELQEYFQNVAKKHGLYPLIQFNTELKGAEFDEKNNVWKITTSNPGEHFTVDYLVTAIGILYKPFIPDLPGLENFKGQTVHSSKWGPEIEYKDKRIAVLGTGASGVQLVSSLSEHASSLTHFIRHAQYVLPAQYRPVSTEERNNVKAKYDQMWEQVFNSAVGFGFEEPPTKVMDVSEEERERVFQELWDAGSGFRFLFGGFSDIAADEAANKEAIKFIHKKIKGIVKDEQKREVLTSSDWFARRPLTDDKYYERFNQGNVFAVSLQKTPIKRITEKGIETEDGRVHLLDLIVFATGFDSVDGSYFNIDFKGRNGLPLREHWKDYPRTHTGVTTNQFPNLFFVNGPGVPFANQPPTVEVAGKFVADLIAKAEEIRKKDQGAGVIESTEEADEAWLQACKDVAQYTLFSKTNSWFFGENIPGRTVAPRFWFGGIAKYREAAQKSLENNYEGFTVS